METTTVMQAARSGPTAAAPLYTAEQKRRRDASRWTLVQGILAPAQFVAFAISLWLILDYLASGEGYAAATVSVMVKTALLYAIMITGALWEKDVFGQYLFADPFYWEDVVSMLVLALHAAYVGALVFGFLDARGQMFLALSAYAAYVVNATQFLLKLRAARLQDRSAQRNAAVAASIGAAE
jgi:3-vinyl bacteriochlorophyllide hydratase